MSLSEEKQTEVIEAFSSMSRYLDDLLNIDSDYFDGLISQIYPAVLVLLFVALWFILRGDLLYVFPCVFLFLCFSVLLILRLPRLGKRANLSAFRTFVRFVLV